MVERTPGCRVQGLARLCRVFDITGRLTHVPAKHGSIYLPGLWDFDRPMGGNLTLYDWGTVVAQLLRNSPDGKPYNLSAMYIEFENNNGDDVSVPEPSRDENYSYYASLIDNPIRDFLRVPIISTSLDSTDDNLFPGGNDLHLFAQTAGLIGFHGKEFSQNVQSRVYGGALVATPDFADATQDLVFARRYYEDTDDQLIKVASSQIGQEWELIFD